MIYSSRFSIFWLIFWCKKPSFLHFMRCVASAMRSRLWVLLCVGGFESDWWVHWNKRNKIASIHQIVLLLKKKKKGLTTLFLSLSVAYCISQSVCHHLLLRERKEIKKQTIPTKNKQGHCGKLEFPENVKSDHFSPIESWSSVHSLLYPPTACRQVPTGTDGSLLFQSMGGLYPSSVPFGRSFFFHLLLLVNQSRENNESLEPKKITIIGRGQKKTNTEVSYSQFEYRSLGEMEESTSKRQLTEYDLAQIDERTSFSSFSWNRVLSWWRHEIGRQRQPLCQLSMAHTIPSMMMIFARL